MQSGADILVARQACTICSSCEGSCKACCQCYGNC